MKKVLISGGSGLIGAALSKLLLENKYQVEHLSRIAGVKNGIMAWDWDYKTQKLDPESIKDVYAIVHLAGAGIADKRWSERRKREIIDSRVSTANLLYDTAQKSDSFPDVFVSASGINYYGSVSGEHIFAESDLPSQSFIGTCCQLWEAAADRFSKSARVVKLRTGVVLSKEGGALEKISLPIKYGLGASLGTGEQYMPYIHIEDLARMYLEAIENPSINGAYNATNGNHITNGQLTKELAKLLKKPLWLPNVPSFALELVFGEMSEILLKGSRASAKKIQDAGFNFVHPNLQKALRDIYR